MTKRRYLPQYVTVFYDRHKKPRYRYRRKGHPSAYLPGPLGSPAFLAALAAAQAAMPGPVRHAAPGSVDDLVTRYFATPGRLGPTLVTQAKVRAVIEDFRERYGQAMVADTTFDRIDRIISAKREKEVKQTPHGPREVGGIHAARKLRKELIRLFDFAVKLRMIDHNPVSIAERVRSTEADRSDGFHSWTEGEIAQFQKRHKLGTRARLAMELMLWTGQRRSDAIRMGPQHVRDGHISVTQAKTGTQLHLTLAPQLRAAVAAMPASDALCYLMTEQGRPFSTKGFGNWFRLRCDEAGLPHCSAHGLRKAMMRRLAEIGESNQSLKSVSGHSRDDQVAHYTRAVDQQRMAGAAITNLSTAMSNRSEQVRHRTEAKD